MQLENRNGSGRRNVVKMGGGKKRTIDPHFQSLYCLPYLFVMGVSPFLLAES
jgi:hypothetical protein